MDDAADPGFPGPGADVGGTFAERDGWVEITIEKKFFDNRAARRAVLCHELCHYVLGAAGIREPATLDNERLTDVAMFAFGLGEVYMARYAVRPSGVGRAGYRLGYLKDDEYRSVLAAARTWWQQGRFRPDEADELEKRLRTRLPFGAFENYWNVVSKRHPDCRSFRRSTGLARTGAGAGDRGSVRHVWMPHESPFGADPPA